MHRKVGRQCLCELEVIGERARPVGQSRLLQAGQINLLRGLVLCELLCYLNEVGLFANLKNNMMEICLALGVLRIIGNLKYIFRLSLQRISIYHKLRLSNMSFSRM